jgi:hypothetical protein
MGMEFHFGIFVYNRCDILSSVLTYAALSSANCAKESVQRKIKIELRSTIGGISSTVSIWPVFATEYTVAISKKLFSTGG